MVLHPAGTPGTRGGDEGSVAMTKERLPPTAGLRRTDAQKPKLLLVDDDHLLLRAIKRALQGCYDVSTSHSPDDALRLLKEQHVDVVVSDYEIPNACGGLWLLEEVGQRYPEAVRILMSSCSLSETVTGSKVIHRFI